MKTEQATKVDTSTPQGRIASWKAGDEARIATYGGMHWVHILHISHGIATTLSERGDVQYWGLGSLETRESYLASCERMRDEWTGAHYREMVALADRPFVKHAKWAEWMERAS